MKKSLLALIAVISLGAVLAGCENEGAEMKKEELESLKNPRKEIPKEALEGMRNQGDLMKKQAEANKAAGVDSRGIPIKQSDNAPAPPQVGTGN